MSGAPPTLIAIDHDNYHAKHVGHTADGQQFFLTTPFLPNYDDDEGQEFVALFLFDAEGYLLNAQIDALGTRAELDYQRAREIYESRLRELGTISSTV